MNIRLRRASLALCAALTLCALAPLAFANEAPAANSPSISSAETLVTSNTAPSIAPALPVIENSSLTTNDEAVAHFAAVRTLAEAKQAEQTRAAANNKKLFCDPALLAAIGTQETTGHSICCSTFACAYGDAFVTATANDHTMYGCGCCTWPGWGGGNSSFRDLGSSNALLREAYDQIASGRPTVVHVAASYGEHWITLIGYQNATDPDNLTLANFIALDPWDGAQITVSERFSLYGDNCQ
ncbi:MAG: hypothetical protein RR862_03030, partial [Eggerthellaceae bacterium]